MDWGLGGKKAYVYGLGITGRGTAEFLIDHGVRVACWDDKMAVDEKDLPLLAPEQVDWSEIGALVKSPGILLTAPLVQEAIEHHVPVVSDTDLLYRREKGNGADFIGITGTNGKSTTTALVGHVLRTAGKKVAVGGNIGQAALSLPELPAGGVYVLEFSSYQLEMSRDFQADGAVFLNLTPDHLERHKSMEGYRDAKLRLFNTAKQDAVKVMGVDQPIMADIPHEGVVRVSVIGRDAEVQVHDGAIWRGGEQVAQLSDFPYLPGPHNAQNIAAALALLVPRWVTLEQFIHGAKTFKGLPHRLEAVGTVGNVRFINDSKATNGDSSVYALQSFDHIYWICGGLPKSGGMGECINHLQAVRAAFTIGQAGDDFARQLEAHNVPVFRCKTLEKAVPEAFGAARTEGFADAVVLLSPAAASMDQFKNFEHRGDVFANCVRSLSGMTDVHYDSPVVLPVRGPNA